MTMRIVCERKRRRIRNLNGECERNGTVIHSTNNDDIDIRRFVSSNKYTAILSQIIVSLVLLLMLVSNVCASWIWIN